jgi:hypothetical protein
MMAFRKCKLFGIRCRIGMKSRGGLRHPVTGPNIGHACAMAAISKPRQALINRRCLGAEAMW